MKVAIIGRGESAKRTWGNADQDQYRLTIAINCAVNIWPVDWLVADDPGTYAKISGRPWFGAAYRSDLAQPGETLPPDLPAWSSMRLEWLDRAKCMPYPLAFSIESALILAIEKGATAIDMYGCLPLSGTPEPSAIASPGRQICDAPERWRLEQRCVRKIIDENPGVMIRAITDTEVLHG